MRSKSIPDYRLHIEGAVGNLIVNDTKRIEAWVDLRLQLGGDGTRGQKATPIEQLENIRQLLATIVERMYAQKQLDDNDLASLLDVWGVTQFKITPENLAQRKRRIKASILKNRKKSHGK